MEIICTSPQTDNHSSTSPLRFLQAGCHSCHQTNSVKALKAITIGLKMYYINGINGRRLSVTEICALYGRLSCGWLRVARHAMVGSGRGWLGAVVSWQAVGRSGRCASTGGFSSIDRLF